MDKVKNFLKIHQQKIALTVGYLLVAVLAFGLGHFMVPAAKTSASKVSQTAQTPLDYSPNISGTQTASQSSSDLNCQGKIKSSSSLIYHMPGGAFYDKTTHPIQCFDTEAQTKAAGFRKSSR